MRRNFTITENRKIVLFYSAVIFLLQSIAPAFQGVMAQTVEGYTDTLCTMYGPVTVFVQLDDEKQQTRSDCYECARCTLQAHLNAAAMAHVFSLDARYRSCVGAEVGPLYRVSRPSAFSPFLSRAPPV
jgi:ferredoxin-like protein FixX